MGLLASPRWVAIATAAIVALYAIWIAGPYLRSIAVRDAAVTTWITVADTPIAGRLDDDPLLAGKRAGPDGRIATVTNERADPVTLAEARAEFEQVRALYTRLNARVTALEAMVAARTRAAETFAQLFENDVSASIEAAQDRISFIEGALEHERNEAERQELMVLDNTTSRTEADLARVRVLDRQRQLSDAVDDLDRAQDRLAAIAAGAFMLADGDDAGDERRGLEEAKLELMVARAELAGVESRLAAHEAVVRAAAAAYEESRQAHVSIPPGALVWSLIAGPGIEVKAGEPIATWVDCSVLLVDAPLSDLEAALVPNGAPALVVIEGEGRTREGVVLFTRGSAATLSSADLAAIAKGRVPGIGQAIVALPIEDGDIAECPIGRAAFVDFPGIGAIDMIRARFRL